MDVAYREGASNVAEADGLIKLLAAGEVPHPRCLVVGRGGGDGAAVGMTELHRVDLTGVAGEALTESLVCCDVPNVYDFSVHNDGGGPAAEFPERYPGVDERRRSP